MAKKKPKPSYRATTLDDLLESGVQYRQPEPEAPAEPEKQPRSFGRVLADVGISGLKGAIGIPEAAVGLADIPTGGRVGKALESVGFRPKEAKAFLDDQYSDEQKQAFRAVNDAEGFGGKFVAALQNPSVVGHSIVESLPAMGAGGVVGRGVLAAAPRLGAAGAAAIGEGVVGGGQAAEQTRQQTADGYLTAPQAALATLSGAGTAAFGALGNKVAKSLGIHDVDTMLVGAVQNSATAKGVVRRVLEGAMSEGVLEELPQSIQEQVLQNAALGKPLDEGVDQAAVLGLLSGAAMGGGANVIGGSRGAPPAQEPPQAAASPVVPALPAPTITVGPDGAAQTADQRQAQRDAAGNIIEVPGAAGQGRGSEPTRLAPPPGLPAPAVQVGPDGTAQTVEQRQAARDAATTARDARRGLVERGPLSRAAAAVVGPVVDVEAKPALGGAAELTREAAAEPAHVPDEPASVTAEPLNDTLAQIAALRDPSSAKDAALITPNSARDVDLSGLQAVETHRGLFVTSNPAKAEAMRALADTVSDDDMGAALGYTAPKAASDGAVVQALDAAGNVVHEQATSAQGLPEAEARAREMAPAGGTVQQTDADAVQARRAAGDGVFTTYEAAEQFRKDQKARGATITALPVETEGGFRLAAQGTPDYAKGEALRGERRAAKARADAGVQDGDITNSKGMPFTIRLPAINAAKKAGAGHEVVPVKGGFVVRRAAPKVEEAAAQQPPAGVPQAPPAAVETLPTEDLAGRKLRGEWTAFAKDSGTKGVSRAEMPQIRAEHRGAMVNFLNARGIAHEQQEVPASDLKPTQVEFSPARVARAKAFEGGDRSILISSDGHVLDGHHQWMAKLDAGEPVKVIRLDAPIERLLSEVKAFPSAEAGEGAAKAPAPAPRAAVDEAIQDFGEKIGGARKDRAVKAGPRAVATQKDVRPAWARRFSVSQIAKSKTPGEEGRWVIRDSRSLDWMKQPKQVGRDSFATREDAEAAIPLAAVSLKHRAVPLRDGKFEIWRDVTDRKRVKVVDKTFDSREEAMGYMAQHAQEIVETNTTFGEADLPRPADATRVGPPRREGDVKDRDFSVTFGFRGVEFGNWNSQSDRQQLLNDAFDGLLDLADVMSIPPRAISLNGELALAFGARGTGLSSARAHYEADKAVINLTKMNGAGSLAHEWFHALDHYFGRQDGKASTEWHIDGDGTRSLQVSSEFQHDAVSGGFRGERSGVRPEVREAYDGLMRTIARKAERYVEDTAQADRFVARAREGVERRIAELRAGLARQLDSQIFKRHNKPATGEQLAEFDTVAQRILEGQALDMRVEGRGRGSLSGVRWTNDALEQLSAIVKAVRGRSGFQTDGHGALDRLRGEIQMYAARLKMLAEAQSGGEKSRTVPTQFAMDAKELDQGRGTDYWTTPHEMAARAFQGYVEDKIAQRGGRSPFLNYGPEDAGIRTPWGAKRPFPHGVERTAINEALDRLISVIETREGDGGNVALFSRAPATDTAAFKKWFGDSKVVDAQGAPLVVYHGTDADFATFSSEFVGEGNGSADWGDGFYFTDRPDAASTYADRNGGNVMPVYLQMKNPATNEVLLSAEIQDVLDDGMGFEDLADVLAARGHDGVVFTHKNGGREYVVFNPRQVKSAIGNNGAFAAADPDIRARRGEGADRGTAVASVRRTVEQLSSSWRNAPEIVVARDMVDSLVPEAVRGYNEGQLAQGAEGLPEGFFYDGKVYLLADQLDHPRDVARVLFHEALGHFGLRGTFGDGLVPILQQIAHLRRAQVAAKAREYGLDMADPVQRLVAAEEVLAEMAQTKPEIGLVRRAIAAIRSWLRSTFSALGDIRLTDDEILHNYLLPARGFVHRGRTAKAGQLQPEAVFSRRAPAADAQEALNDPRDFRARATQAVADMMAAPGTVSWWHKSVGSMHDLAKRSPKFAKVFDAVQGFLGDVSAYATEAADKAPTLLPKLETWRDIARSPISAEDTKAIAAPIFEGTLTWGRDAEGKLAKMADLERRYTNAPTELKAKVLQPGVVFTDAELREHFKATPAQVGLYREFRAAVDQSLNRMAISEMLRFGGADVEAMRSMAMDAGTAAGAATVLRDHLLALADEQPARADVLKDTAAKVTEKAAAVQRLVEHGYAPLSRFGHYTVDVVDEKGDRAYFGMFESRGEANRMARRMRENYPKGTITQGTVSQQAYKLFSGITPETLELFGEMVGLEAQGDEAQHQLFQQYLKLAKANRSAMKRLIERKGIAGFNEDAGRVLAGFVYSNARLTSTNLHTGEISRATADISKEEGELKDVAVKLADYVRNPQEEAQALRGMLFAQYLGGSLASAMVNMTQPIAVTMPYLSQWGGAIAAAGRMRGALADVLKKSTGDAKLDAALKKAEEEGIVAPQEVHQLMAQAQGRGSLRAGDGTTAGNLAAKAANLTSKVALAWGKPFAAAEQFNRRVTFIAAYRTAVAEGIADPARFAEEAIRDTQFVYNKGNKPQWARGAIGGTLFTFKQYSISYMELLHRMATRGGSEGRKAALFSLAMLFLMGGAGGMPFMGDAEDAIDGIMQRLGYSFSTKQARRQFFIDVLGKQGAAFVERGVSGLPGVPIDVAGRLGMGNLIPGTGLLTKKQDYGRDVAEILGPAGDLAQRAFQGAGQVLSGKPLEGVETAAPTAVRNVSKAFDMFQTGMYRDQRGRKVIDVDGYDALAKAIGFQPSGVAQVQEANAAQQDLIGQNKLMKTELADAMAQAVFERDPEGQQKVRERMLSWNKNNPQSPVTVDMAGVRRRVMAMRQSKAERIEKSAPKAIRGEVRRALEEGAV
ncbi:PLxRFG domain-containing protein [Variovorax sp.]|uniref:PLxRFG domain-containing protein n=1 Tax=Variovorax sp. TaxID=1871043 RepID=UPI003BAD122D